MPFLLMAWLWLPAQFGTLQLPAEPWTSRPWFFDPFGWQLVFFLGFFLMRGTLTLPLEGRGVLYASIAVLVASIPFAWYVVLDAVPLLREAARAIAALTDKTEFGILRLVHFLALAVIAFRLVGAGGERLNHPVARPVTAILMKVGQQSLAVFMTGMVVAQIIGIVLDHTGRGAIPVAAVNIAGFAILVATAYAVAWFKQPPWKA
jgi:hypothetical protein